MEDIQIGDYVHCDFCQAFHTLEISRGGNHFLIVHCGKRDLIATWRETFLSGFEPCGDLDFKHCPHCDRDYPLTIEYFKRDRKAATGFSSYCRKCRNEAEKERRRRKRAADGNFNN